MAAQKLPAPFFSQATKIWLTEASAGRVTFKGLASEDYLNPLGTVHGGWISAILDSAMACAVHSLIKSGQTYTTTSMTIYFVRPLMADAGELTCEGVAVHAGRSLATSEGKLLDARGRLIAHGSESCMIMDARA